MHGAGNDFVVIDARARAVGMTAGLARALGDRQRGVGFDQLAILHPSDDADARLEFWNSDGSLAGACGNATRCIADMLMAEGHATPTLATAHGTLRAHRRPDGLISVNMGRALTDWRAIPLAEPADTAALPLQGAPAATSMGNPHCTFFVEDLALVDLAARGPEIEHHPLFPERTNVQFVEILSPREVRALVWERGAGATLASGSSTCAITVAGVRQGRLARQVRVHLPGGILDATWRPDGEVELAGPVATAFEGRIAPEIVASLEAAT